MEMIITHCVIPYFCQRYSTVLDFRLPSILFVLACTLTRCSCSLLESDEENAEMRIGFGSDEEALDTLGSS